MAVDGATKEKKKKKKIKVEEDAGNTNVVQCHDVSVQTVVKKEPLEVNTRDEEKKKKKKKKKVKEEVEAIPMTVCYDTSVQTTVKAELSETKISDAPEKTIKKKKRKMKEEPEPLLEIISEDGECLVSKKKKAKKKRCTDQVEGMKNKKMKKKVEVKEEEEEEEVDLGHGVETVEKKKKKKRKNEQELNAELEDGETKKKRKKKGADECKEEKVKKKKKKPSADDISSNEKPEKKSKKQKKNFKAVDEGESHPQANGGHVSSPDKRTKRKEKADDVSEKVEAEPAGKKGGEEDGNKALEEVKKQRASRAAIVFLSAKPGNQDEVSIDQERRLALQRDVDKESQPKPNLGQWGTVRFDSSDRQEKFLRLMGGFKKSSQPVAGSSGSANMALGKEGQQTLQQGLLGEFERAQSRHMDFRIKGAGLGFTAPSNKKFTIDTNARNSIRFDD